MIRAAIGSAVVGRHPEFVVGQGQIYHEIINILDAIKWPFHSKMRVNIFRYFGYRISNYSSVEWIFIYIIENWLINGIGL